MMQMSRFYKNIKFYKILISSPISAKFENQTNLIVSKIAGLRATTARDAWSIGRLFFS